MVYSCAGCLFTLLSTTEIVLDHNGKPIYAMQAGNHGGGYPYLQGLRKGQLRRGRPSVSALEYLHDHPG